MSFNGTDFYDPTATVQPKTYKVLLNNGFFPNVDVADFIAVARISNEYRTEVIEQNLLEAMDRANQRLNKAYCYWSQQNYAHLDTVPCDQLNQKSRLMHHYYRAVYNYAKCHLMRDYATMNRKEQAENAGKEAETVCTELLHRHEYAIGALMQSLPNQEKAGFFSSPSGMRGAAI